MPARWMIAARAIVFLAAFGFINFTPFYKQVLHHRAPWARDWVMFSGFGLAVCDVKFSRALLGGGSLPIDRFDVLGYANPLDAPHSVRRIPNEEGAHKVASSICHKLGRGADVRMRARCASTKGSGWRRVDWGDTNVCEGR